MHKIHNPSSVKLGDTLMDNKTFYWRAVVTSASKADKCAIAKIACVAKWNKTDPEPNYKQGEEIKVTWS